jgi:hypothetical protein
VLATEISVPAAPSAVPTAPQPSPQRLRSLARAARQDILRRLAPPLRHDMVVHLQSLGMVAEALGARLDRGAASGEDLQAGISKLNRLSRQAVAHCLDVCTWVDPGEDDTASLREGVAEVVRLLSTGMNFRGFDLLLQAGEGDLQVGRSALRFLLAGAILSLADAAPGPGALTVHTEPRASHAVVAVAYQPQPEGSFTRLHEAGEAPLAWPELQALAAEQRAELLHHGHAIVLRLPRARVTTPLKMAPV